MPTDALVDLYRRSLPVDDFAVLTAASLGPHGFAPGNSLAVVGVCRDELMFPAEQQLATVWGPAFDMSSLGGMVFLGASGLSAAAGHAPGSDGRRRFVHVVMPHIGLDDAHGAGLVRRDGQADPSTACGALVGLRRQLESGTVAVDIDPDDLEMSLLCAALLPLVRAADAARVPDLLELTDLVRTVATNEIVRLSHDLLASPTTDVALFSTLMIHGSAGDRVAVVDARVWIGDDPVALSVL